MPVYNINGQMMIDFKAVMEHGTLRSGSPSYSIAHHAHTRCAHTIKLNGATSVTLDNPQTYEYLLAYFYDASMAYVSYVEVAYPSATITIPNNAEYMRFALEGISEFKKEIKLSVIGGSDYPRFVKNAKTQTDSEKFTFDVCGDMYSFGRMLLPPNYDAEGEPAPLILWLDGSGSVMGTWEADFVSSKFPYLRYLRDEGFAVLSIFAWGSNYYTKYPQCGISYPYPIPTNLKVLKKGIEWALDRYNLDADEIHLMSKSQGGQCATYFATYPIVDFKSIGMFSPVNDSQSMPGGTGYADLRKAITDDMGYINASYYISNNFSSYSAQGIQFAKDNLPQIMRKNEAFAGLIGGTAEQNMDDALTDCETFWTERVWEDETRDDIYTHHDYKKLSSVPVKIWGASDDDQTPYLKMVEVVHQMQNGGNEAVMRTLERNTGGHNCADLGTTTTNVTTALGITYTNVPVGWVENIEWIRQHMAK